MLAGYTAVLCSPGFLFVEEQPGRLDDYALAARLALFLWNSPPDDALRALAAKGQLHDPAILRAETERLLADPKSQRFADAFLDYWLDLRKIEDTTPSTTLYNDYYLDDALAEAAQAETRLYFAELLRGDMPARTIVDSDFTYLNDRLARHYGISGVEGIAMRRVTLPADSVRGGLLTQASVLKVTANGTTTSPVLRGKWICDRILGVEIPPPPPTVPAVEPDIRGAVTIRQQLDKHRAEPSCAVCHSKMDPAGFALESFDIMGGWRDRYRAADEAKAGGAGHRHERLAVRVPLRVAGRFRRRASRRPRVSRHPRVQAAPARGRGGAGPQLRAAARDLCHRRPGAVQRSAAARSDSRKREGERLRHPQPRARHGAKRSVPEQVSGGMQQESARRTMSAITPPLQIAAAPANAASCRAVTSCAEPASPWPCRFSTP